MAMIGGRLVAVVQAVVAKGRTGLIRVLHEHGGGRPAPAQTARPCSIHIKMMSD